MYPSTHPPPFLSHPHRRAASHLRAAHHPVPASRLITPFTSTRTPSSFYLADPLNVYAHLGIPRPYVYLVGPRSVLHSKRGSQDDLCGTGVGLTLFCGRCCAQELAGRWTSRRRRRKRPPTTTKANPSGKGKECAIDPHMDNSGGTSPCMTPKRARRLCSPGSGLTGMRCTVFLRCSRHQGCSREFLLLFLFLFFFVFWVYHTFIHSSSRPFTPNSSASLAYSPDFMSMSTSTSNIHPNPNLTYDLDPPSPQQIQHLRRYMTNILHALTSTFTTCACGACAKDCALTQMAAFVDAQDECLSTHPCALG